MPVSTTMKPKHRDSVNAQALPDGSGLLFDTESAKAYPITESAMKIWMLCDGKTSVEDIVRDLESHYEVDQATVQADTLKLIEELIAKNLLDGA